ncbi:MAG TPA: hypothetical protein VM754_12350 [Actinomycetota bacterium]|nr:hypothetical protein [Actinomycetota bacterium]
MVRTAEPDQVRRRLATTAEVDTEFAVYILTTYTRARTAATERPPT